MIWNLTNKLEKQNKIKLDIILKKRFFQKVIFKLTDRFTFDFFTKCHSIYSCTMS